jgi:uncharacterized membrane protein
MKARLRSNWDLLLLTGLTILSAAVVLVISYSPVLIVASIFLELVAPGYAISSAVFARREISALELLLCALGTSLVVAALGGILLDQLPGDMGQGAWLALLVGTTLLAVSIAIALTPMNELPLAFGRSSGLPKSGPGDLEERVGLPVWLNLGLGILAAILVVGALVIARDATEDVPGFSELSAVPNDMSGEMKLMIEVRSHEEKAASYELVVREDGRRRSLRALQLRPGQDWHSSAQLASGARRVTVTLYRAGRRQPYLQTSYFPDAKTGQSGEVPR